MIKEFKTDDYGLLMVSQLLENTESAKWAYEYYKASAEMKKPVFHSIGYKVISSSIDKADNSTILKELLLIEGSTLSKRPANPEAIFVGIKSFEQYDIDYLLSEAKI